MTRPLVLVLNSGSSSIKSQLVEPASGATAASVTVERIGEAGGVVDHAAGIREIFEQIDITGVAAVGHRVVHGGDIFHEPTLITDDVVAALRELSPLAPLHNPANVTGIDAAREVLPDVPHVAVFDTAFFHTLPEASRTYAIDAKIAARYGIRRYGFHGTSHDYVSAEASAFLGHHRSSINQIVLHLGNGASASAIHHGRAVDTSMGFTPLEGLVMGTRPGDLDPGIVTFLQRSGMTADAVADLLNRDSGLLGLCGVNDFRELTTRMGAGDAAARLAYGVYIHRLRHYLGAYLLELGEVHAITFTAGVGENSPDVRADALAGLRRFGIDVDPARNASPSRATRRISTDDSPTSVLVIPTNEELAIARAAVGIAQQ